MVDFERLFDALPTAYLVMDRDLVIVGANRAYLTMLDRSRSDLLGRYVFDAFPPEPDALDEHGRSSVEISFLRARDTGRPDLMPLYRYDVLDSHTGALAQRFWSLISAPMAGDDGRTEFVLQRVEDVTDFVRAREAHDVAGAQDGSERLQAVEAELFVQMQQLNAARAAELSAVEALRRSEERARSVLDTAVDAIVTFDRDGVVTSFNRAAELMFGRPAPTALGGHLSTLLPAAGSGAAGAQPTRPGEAVGLRHDGTTFPAEVSVSDAGPGSGVFTAIVRDVTERRRLEDQLAHLSLHDPLTGLANRSLLRERLEHAVARTARHPGWLAVLFIDLDRFKCVNDTLGHAAGDELLVLTAERLRTTVRTEDLVARFGGDEFVVLCEELSDPAEADIIVARVRAGLQSAYTERYDGLGVGASIGVVTDSGQRSAAELLRDADTAMYEVKRTGAVGRAADH